MPRKAFTLIELVAATALSTLLFVVALSVIRTLHQVPETGAAPAWTESARRQLAWDLENSVVIRQDSHGLVLGGYGSLDARSLSPTHLPVTVVYSLRQVAASLWLVREQTSLEPGFSDGAWSELVCGGVKSFTVTGSYNAHTVPKTSGDDQDATPVVFRELTNVRPVPDRVRVRLDLQGSSLPAMNEVLFLH